MIRRRIILGIVLAVLFGLGWWVGRGQAKGSLYENLDLFVEVLHRIERHYVDVIEPAKVVEGAIQGMLKDLDPYSQYLDSRSYDNLQSTTQGKFSGIGVVVSVRDGFPTVIAPIEGTPAWEAGLHSGDAIVGVEGRSTHGFTVQDAAELLRGPVGTDVRISVRRYGDDQDHEYLLTRREIVTKSVPYAFVHDGSIGYLRLANFSSQSGAELRAAMQELKRDGAKRLVLDVRSNPGGLLDQAVDVAEQFLAKGSLVVYTKGRASGQDRRYFASESRPENRWPMVVLIDEGSASASEIVAGSLQDFDRALAIGASSFGKGLVQSVFPLRGQDVALKLTTARYYTPSGRSIHRDDLIPVGHGDEALDDGEGAAEPADAERPAFETKAGRTVFGGGGIMPDIEVRRDSLPPLALRAARNGWPFRFANQWVNTHQGPEIESLDPEIWRAFVDFLRDQDESFNRAALRDERAWLEHALRRELARRSGGEEAAARVMLARDPAFKRAVEILARAHAPHDVFAAAGITLDGDAPRRLGASQSKSGDGSN